MKAQLYTARWRSSETRQKRIQFRKTPRVFAPPEYLRDLHDRPAPSGRPISHLETTELPPCQTDSSGALTLASLREREQCKLHSCYFPNGRLQ